MPAAAGFRFTCAALALLWAAPSRAEAAPPLRVQWEGLPAAVTGKTVSIATAGGVVVRGKAVAVEPDALVVAGRTGTTRVPRAALHRFDLQSKGKKFRVIGTVLGSAAGLAGGAGAWWGIGGGVLSNKRQGQAAAAFVAIWAGATAGGYLAGNAADRRWTPVEIVP